ncbi:DUF3303 domain-containing protein [Saccharopolyspora sp. ASAGF58]|uniref:DUF3303 domain-containing protein n=1 Tax=Saccharopolyspora sp. ASAGF58 TaxID=2719023 RepID=UPI00353029DB
MHVRRIQRQVFCELLRHGLGPDSVDISHVDRLSCDINKIGGNAMLWYCRFRWHQNTRADDVRRRVLEQHDAGTNKPDKIRGWYNLAGGGSGFLLVDTDDPHELTDLLQPYMDLVSWDVHAVYEVTYQEMVDQIRQKFQTTT